MRLAVLFICCSCLLNQLSAQTKEKKPLHFGMQVGGGISSLLNRGVRRSFQYSNRTALQALAWVQSSGSPIFFSAEAGFAVKGSVVTYFGFPFPYKFRHSCTYAQINPWFGVKPTRSLTIQIGTEFGYLLDYESPVILVPEKWEIAGAMQVQYNFGDRLGIGTRGSLSMTPLFPYFWTDANGNQVREGGEYLYMLTIFARTRIGK